MHNWLLVLIGTTSVAQTNVQGTVVDVGGAGLPFVSVRVAGSPLSVETDQQGRFLLDGLWPGAVRLSFAVVGYERADTTMTLSLGANSLRVSLRAETHLLDDVEVRALRAGDRAPFAKSLVSKEEVARVNLGVDLPYVLDLQPNVVSTSDGGTGIGYTYMRIRGTDGTRTNITLNGVPFNDAESQGAFLVNLPDIATSAEDIEVQRGVGTSTNGPAAFGASINLRTTAVRPEAWGRVDLSGGAFGTLRTSVSGGTGLLNPGEGEGIGRFSLDMRLSSITSDGYVDRASADLKSYFLQGAWIGARRSLRYITFRGKEVTYQAWGGVPREVIDTARTYNPYTYANEVDDYDQTHHQLLFDQRLGKNSVLNVTLFRVLGKGYFEQFREDDDLSTYGIARAVINGDTITTTDIIRRRWLDNSLTGANASLEVRFGPHRLLVGGNYSDYQGEHFGEVVWAAYAGDLDIRDRYYANDARKTDANGYAKLTYALNERLDLFGDAQVRTVRHTFLGYGSDLERLERTLSFIFFNPKAGVLWRTGKGGKAYASVAIGNREPNREDLVESTPDGQPKPEHLIDYELGFEQRKARWAGGINLYYMDYKDQLVLTGELNDVGAALRTNVAKSYRAGVELSGAWQATKRLRWKGNLALSRNRVRAFTEFVDDWDNGGQQAFSLGERDLSFSPGMVGASDIAYRFIDRKKSNVELSVITKFVGAQYLDNTSSAERRLHAYVVNDLRINASFTGCKGLKALELNLTVRNLFSELYESNGWTYSFISEGRRQQLVGLYPQAPLNVLAGLTVRF